MRRLILVVFTLLSVSAQAGIPRVNLKNAVVQHAGAMEDAFENLLGRKLTAQQKQELEEMVSQDFQSNFIEAKQSSEDLDKRSYDTSKAIYCVGGQLSFGVVQGYALCLHVWDFTPYSLSFIGGGAVALSVIEAKVFRLNVSWNSKRYEKSFDPIPGDYFLINVGGTLGLGGTIFSGDAGNKSLSGSGINFGLLGIEFSANGLRIH